MPTAQGWAAGQLPAAAPGLKVNAFAAGLKHPRWIQVLPNGDVTVAEACCRPAARRARCSTTRWWPRCAAPPRIGDSPNRITLLRDADGDGVAEQRHAFLENLNQPFGMALVGDTFYVGNTDGVVAFPYTPGATRITGAGPPADAASSPAATGHAACCPAPTAAALRRRGLAEQHRRARHGGRRGPRLHLRTRPAHRSLPHLRRRPAQPGRPGLGADHRPAVDGGQRTRRPGRRDAARLPDLGAATAASTAGRTATGARRWTIGCRRTPALVARALTPDYALGGHTASLGLCWMPAGTLPGFDSDGMVIGQHGSWNRSTLSGYQVVFVPFADGRPAGAPRDILCGLPRAGRIGVLWPPGGRGDRAGPASRCWWPTTWATWSGAWPRPDPARTNDERALARRDRRLAGTPKPPRARRRARHRTGPARRRHRRPAVVGAAADRAAGADPPGAPRLLPCRCRRGHHRHLPGHLRRLRAARHRATTRPRG